MNIQNLMKQAQQMQKEITVEKQKLDGEVFELKKSFVEIKMTGNKKLMSVKIDQESIEKDEIELLEDLILVSVNELLNDIEKETEKRLGKHTKGMPGLF